MARLILSLLFVSVLSAAILAPPNGDLHGAPGVLVGLSPLLARALSGPPTGGVDGSGWRGNLPLLAETVSAVVGTVAAIVTCLIGAGAIAAAAATCFMRWDFVPIDPGSFAVAWLGGALAVDLGLSVLFTRPMPWRRSPVLAPLMAAPGIVAALGVSWFVARHPAQHFMPTPLLAFGVPAFGLSLGVLLTGPLRPPTRRFCQIGTLLTAMVAAVPGLLDTGLGFPGTADIALNSMLAGLLAWHAIAGPAGRFHGPGEESPRRPGTGSCAASPKVKPIHAGWPDHAAT